MDITREEYELIKHEITGNERSSFNTLVLVTERIVRPKVNSWCARDTRLCRRSYEDDIMQEIHLRLMMKVVTFFMKRDEDEINFKYGPNGFQGWIILVAHNATRDFANKIGKQDGFETELDPGFTGVSYDFGSYEIDEYRAILQDAVSIALNSKQGIHKILSWLALAVYMLDYDIKKKNSNELIIANFENKSLFEMYEIILAVTDKIPWLVITDSQKQKLNAALNEVRTDGIVCGNILYKDFFMKKNGVADGKKSISDWVYRMNNLIVGNLNNDDNKMKDEKKEEKDNNKDLKKKKTND